MIPADAFLHAVKRADYAIIPAMILSS